MLEASSMLDAILSLPCLPELRTTCFAVKLGLVKIYLPRTADTTKSVKLK